MYRGNKAIIIIQAYAAKWNTATLECPLFFHNGYFLEFVV